MLHISKSRSDIKIREDLQCLKTIKIHHLIILDPHSVQNVIKTIYNTNTLCNYYFSQFVNHILDPQGFLGLEPVDFCKTFKNFSFYHENIF